jgi:hypothetical protein
MAQGRSSRQRVMAASQFLSRRRAKHQAPNPKLQRNPGIETPKTKLQTPKKSQVPSSKPQHALRAWSLELLWSLEFGVWCLGPGASLELGVWNLELVAWAPCPLPVLLINLTPFRLGTLREELAGAAQKK